MDITLVAIAGFILLAIVFLLLFLSKSISNKSFKADDGSVFDNQTDLDLYQKLFESTKPFFSLDEENSSTKPILGFDKLFLTKLTKEGFKDLQTLVKYRKQIKLLSDLINE